MKNKVHYYLILSFLLIVFPKITISADTNAVAYFPLHVGNKYVYNETIAISGYPTIDTVIRSFISNDTVILGRKYFKFNNFPKFPDGWYRVDSLSGSLMYFYPSNNCSYYISEYFFDSLAALIDNDIMKCGNWPENGTYKCNIHDPIYIYNLNTSKKGFHNVFHFSSTYSTFDIHFIKYIGIFSYYSYSSNPNSNGYRQYTLKGCTVNGILYGDTTMPVHGIVRKNFFPLKTGNKFIYDYHWSGSGGSSSSIKVASITNDTIAYGKKYYKAVNTPIVYNEWIRVDSVTGSIYRFNRDSNCSYYDHELIIDSLLCGLHDSTKNCLSLSSRSVCTDTSYINIFGKLRQKKIFEVNCSGSPVFICSTSRTYLDSIGLYYYDNFSSGGGGFGSVTWQLRGCVINGIVYGDTSLIGVTPVSLEVPERYSLSQNYPNPFNPVTNIKFDLPEKTYVKLVIYDILGNVIETIVNEELSPGKYNSTWDASKYSSGVYYYKLITDNSSESKKMVLIK